MKRVLQGLVLLLSSYPMVLFAQSTSGSNGMSFTPPSTDYSMILLGDIFGVVNGVLHGTGSQVLGQMFGVFNAAVLFLAGIVITYTLFSSILNTAHDGEVLGRNMSSIWIPIRSVVGIALLLPKATGYSTIQVIVMWIIVMGIGAADQLWNTVLNYLEGGGVIIQASVYPSQSVVSDLVGPIFKSEICTYGLQAALKNNQVPGGLAIPSLSNTLENPFTSSSGAFPSTQLGYPPALKFPGLLWNTDGSAYNQQFQFNGFCGNVNVYANISPSAPNIANMQTARQVAIKQVIIDLSPYAQQVANFLYNNPTNSITLQSALPTGALDLAAADYEGLMRPSLNQSTQNPAIVNAFIAGAKQEGWLLAGMYYYNLAVLNNKVTGSFKPPQAQFSSQLSAKGPTGTDISALQSLLAGSSASAQELTSYIQKEIAQAQGGTQNPYIGGGGGPFSTVSGGASVGIGVLSSVFSGFTNGLSNVIYGMKALLGSEATNTNPVIALTLIGTNLINFVGDVWLTGAIAVFVVALVGSIMSCSNPVPFAISSTLLWILPMLTAVLLLLFTTGAMMAYYIPLIPFIVFTFAAIGWFFAVIESMIAAPLVALGIAHPEGNPFLGKAEPALMLIINVFLRPSLMIIGFIVGIMMSYVAIWVMNAGFMKATDVVFQNATGISWYLAWAAVMVIYTFIVMTILNKVFTLIHIIPDNIMRWLSGGMVMPFGAETAQMSGDVKGQFEGASKAAGEGAMGSTSQAAKGITGDWGPGGGPGPGPGPDLQVGPGGPGGPGDEGGPGPGEGGGGAAGGGGAEAAAASGAGAPGTGLIEE